MKGVIAIIIILATIGLFGCVTHAKETTQSVNYSEKYVVYNNPTKVLYAQLKTKFYNHTKMNLNYNIILNRTRYGEVEGVLEYKRLNKDYMYYYDLYIPMQCGGKEQYDINGTKMACEPTNNCHMETVCEFGTLNNSLWNVMYPDTISQINMSLTGTKNIGNKSCYNFRIHQNEIDFLKMFGYDVGTNKYRNVVVETCIDNETGIPLIAEVKDNKMKTILMINISKISYNITEKDVLPKDYVMKSKV